MQASCLQVKRKPQNEVQSANSHCIHYCDNVNYSSNSVTIPPNILLPKD